MRSANLHRRGAEYLLDTLPALLAIARGTDLGLVSYLFAMAMAECEDVLAGDATLLNPSQDPLKGRDDNDHPYR